MLLARTINGLEYVFDRPVRILVVDDDPIMREFAVTQLAQPGCEIVTAEDGEAASAILEGDQTGFDLVLSDLEMPRMNGFALVDEIRRNARLAHLPVVVITSREDMFAIDRAYEVGATSFVTKPVNWRLLGYQLRYIMRASRIEAEMRAARDEAQRLSAVRESLLLLLQHETRTPLHGIMGYASLLLSEIPERASLKEHAQQVMSAAGDLSNRLRRIFYYAQLSTGALSLEPESVSPSDVVDEALPAVRARAAALGVNIVVRAEDNPPAVSCDLRHMAGALQELLANAVCHSPTGGTVEVTIKKEGGAAVIAVRDHGPGLSESVLAHCREPFVQGASPMTREVQGLGLGLPLAQRIVELHGGELRLSAAEGGGTLAQLALPAAAACPYPASRQVA